MEEAYYVIEVSDESVPDKRGLDFQQYKAFLYNHNRHAFTSDLILWTGTQLNVVEKENILGSARVD
jgi:hypothetical protein